MGKNLRVVNSHRCIQFLMFAFLAVIPAAANWPSEKAIRNSSKVAVAVYSRTNSKWYTDGWLSYDESMYEKYSCYYKVKYDWSGENICSKAVDYGDEHVMTIDSYVQMINKKIQMTKKATKHIDTINSQLFSGQWRGKELDKGKITAILK